MVNKVFKSSLKIHTKPSKPCNKNYLINLMELSVLTNELVYSHSKDKFEIPEPLFFLSNLSSIKFIDLSTSECKGEKKFNGYHGITLTECFAKYEETKKIPSCL